jgi:hypothetical protein
MTAHNRFNRRLTALAQALVATTSLATVAPQALAGDDLMAAITGGKPTLFARYRFETVDQENFAREADASTLRTQLGYSTGDYKGFGATLQFEDVRTVGADDFNDTVNGKGQFPVVADPEGTEVNQAYLSYAGLPSTLVKYGRMVLNLDNQRFIGSVGFRQNEQTYDAFVVENKSLPATTITLGHISNVNRIFGEDHPTMSDIDMKGEIVNVSYAGFKPVKITGYGYFFDYEPGQVAPALVTLSNRTLGLRFDGAYAFPDFKLLYTAEYATQDDYKDGTAAVDADYLNLMLGAEYKGVTVKLGYEVLGGDGVYGFATPFATLHAFNGWADRFLNTPASGLEDAFVSVGGAHWGVNWLVVYHDYQSDNLSIDYGDEWNFLIAKKINKHLSVSAKYAAYNGDQSAPALFVPDADKLWLTAEFQF